ncbi:SET domain-containing protein-lysine N-methyltransferase [Candidatus Pacearchaeota archaeon]|nr:SET domain-containing protein-lysine N-methyltransferase [Candidatus Pacearchaeota archaeon]
MILNIDVEVRKTGKYGKGVFAKRNIEKGELIFNWEGGKIYTAEKCLDLPKEIADHAIQFEEHKWIDTNGFGRYANHSCNPNSGFTGKFKLAAMREIKKGEEILWDYEMTENSNWKMNCKCGEKDCRKVIGAYNNMPESVRQKYNRYISTWLVKQ